MGVDHFEGNFLANPVMRYLDHTVAGPIPVAEEIDRSGLFVGNHHLPVASQIECTADLIRGFVEA